MKTLKSIILGLTLLVVSTVSYAAKPAAALLSKSDVLNAYVNAIVHGKVDGVDEVLDRDVKHTLKRGEKEFRLDKKQIVQSLKASENMEQACTFNTIVMEETDDSMVVKLTMKYEGYTRTNLITISSRKSDFRITKIETLS